MEQKFLETIYDILVEGNVVNRLVSMSDEALSKLKYIDFPDDKSIESNVTSYQDRKRIFKFKDALRKDYQEKQLKSNKDLGIKHFESLKLKPGEYTNFGIFNKSDNAKMYFTTIGGTSETPYAIVAKGELKRISKKEWDNMRTSRNSGMAQFSNKYRLD